MNQHETDNQAINKVFPQADYQSSLERQQKICADLRVENSAIRARVEELEQYVANLTRCPDCVDGNACLPGGCGIEGCERCGKPCLTCNGSCEIDPRGLYKAARARVEELEAARKWISVKEREPNEKFVLACGPRTDGETGMWRCAAACLGGGDFRDGWGNSLNATHWLPLPAAPKGGE